MSTCGILGWTPNLTRSVSSFLIQVLALLDMSMPCLSSLSKVWSAVGRKRSGSSTRVSKSWIHPRRLSNMSSSSSGSQVTCMSSLLMDSKYLFYFWSSFRCEHSQGRPSCHSCKLPLSASLCSSQCSYGTYSPVADLTDVHVIKGGHICFRLEAKEYWSGFLQHAHSTSVRATGWTFLGVKPVLLKIGSATLFMVMGANKTWYCFVNENPDQNFG